MAELLRQVQAVLLTAATTIDVWRDGAIAVLAGVVIACLYVVVEGSRA
jgi:hypothetical protein